MQNKLTFPMMIYIIKENSDYNKDYTIEDVPASSYSKELYDYLCDDWMTLGRPIPTYEEWKNECIEKDLEDKKRSSKYKTCVDRLAVRSLEEMESYFKSNPTTRVLDCDREWRPANELKMLKRR